MDPDRGVSGHAKVVGRLPLAAEGLHRRLDLFGAAHDERNRKAGDAAEVLDALADDLATATMRNTCAMLANPALSLR